MSSEDTWTIERIRDALGAPTLAQRFLSEINTAPAHELLGVFARWERIAKDTVAAFDRGRRLAPYDERGEDPPGPWSEGTDAAVRHDDPYDTSTEARGAGIYLARQAEAHLALGDIDAAVAVSQQAIDQLGGADSARGTTTLADLRTQLTAHRQARPVADFLDLTA